MFRGYYLHGCGQVDRTPEQVDQALSPGRLETNPIRREDSQFREAERKKQQKDKAKEEGGIFPPEELITTLATALHREMIEPSIPYLQMHLKC
ncbi:hypothetical protein DL770_002659 [Monosporascus sp. CRB-9-2]|nr:hypothetical protein DL770_002659 [Monosporascus sp. CRB-9-2]